MKDEHKIGFFCAKKLCALMCILLTASLAFAQADFLGLPASAASSALANACYSFDPQSSSVFANPANMYNLRRHMMGISYEMYPSEVSNLSLSGVFATSHLRLGAGFIQHGVPGIIGRDDVGNATGEFDYFSQALVFGMAYGVSAGRVSKPCRMSYSDCSGGLALKFITQNEGDATIATGAALDLGASFKLGYYRWGVVVKNIYGVMVYDDAESSDERIPIVIGAGGSFNFCGSSWAELALETKEFNDFAVVMGGHFLATEYAGFRGGIRLKPFSDDFAHDMRISIGGSIYKSFGVPAELSYSVTYLPQVGSFAFGGALNFNTFAE